MESVYKQIDGTFCFKKNIVITFKKIKTPVELILASENAFCFLNS